MLFILVHLHLEVLPMTSEGVEQMGPKGLHATRSTVCSALWVSAVNLPLISSVGETAASVDSVFEMPTVSQVTGTI